MANTQVRQGAVHRKAGAIMEGMVQPTLAYVGHKVEVAFLKSLLEGCGIACSVDLPVWGENGGAV
jgi:hypothetical protein